MKSPTLKAGQRCPNCKGKGRVPDTFVPRDDPEHDPTGVECVDCEGSGKLLPTSDLLKDAVRA